MSNDQMANLVGALAITHLIQWVFIAVLFFRGTVHLNGMNSQAFFANGKPSSRDAFDKMWNDTLDEMKLPRKPSQ